MKKTLFAIIAFATTFAATSCQGGEELAQQLANKPMVINAVAEGIGTKSRAEMAYKYDILWSESDQILVKDNSSSATFTLQSGAGTTKGTFVQDGEGTKLSGEVQAYYPASLVQEDGSLAWPAAQTSATVVPMYSTETLGGTGTEQFAFASLGAVLQIVFNTKQENVTLKSITLKDDNATMSGTFTVDENGKASIIAADKAGITLDLSTGKALGDGANYFNIAVPAGTYSNLSITFTATDESTCTLNGNVTLNHNTVGRLTLTGTKFKGSHEYVLMSAKYDGSNYTDLKWATCNLGASSPSDYGDYYAWGETSPKDEYNYNNAKYYLGKSSSDDFMYSKYCTASKYGTVDNRTRLELSDDAARQQWGGSWRMPTQAEFQALLEDCTWTWTTEGGKSGYKVTEKNARGNSIFLPAAGYRYTSSLLRAGNGGYYWSSSLKSSESSRAYYLYSGSDEHKLDDNYRYLGQSVRPVTE